MGPRHEVDSMICFGHPVAAPERFLVAVRCNSFLLLFSFLSMLFLLLWLWWWWPVLVILWRHFKGARWRCGSIACLLLFFCFIFCFCCYLCCFCCCGCGGQCWSSCGGFSKVLGGGAGDTTLLPCLSSQLPAPLISSQSSSSSLYQAIRCMFGEKRAH